MKKRTRASYSSFIAIALFLLAQSVYALQEGDFQYEVNEADPATVTITDYSGNGGDLEIPSTLAGKTVTIIGDEAFRESALTSVSIPASVTSIGDRVFLDCYNLKSIEVDADNITYSSIDGILFNKAQTTLIQYPAGRTKETDTIPKGVTSIGDYAFSDCNFLISVTLPNSLISIGDYAFNYCVSLTSVTIPDSVTSIGSYAFKDCAALTSVTIPDSVKSIGDYAFSYCDSLTSVTIPESVTSIGDSAFSYCASLTSVTIPDSVTSIGDSAFRGSALTSVTIPASVTSIGDRVFLDCANFNSIDVDAQNTAYSSIDGILFNKAQTTLIQYPSGIQESAYVIPASVTSIGDYAFKDCTALTSVTIPDSLISIGDSAFTYCDSLTSVTIPDSVTSIGSYVFSDCDSLKSVTIPDSVTTIGSSAFYLCKALTSVTIPDSITSISDETFSYCALLTSVTLPNSLISIGEYAFNDCDSLKSVTIPSSVTSIESWAFQDCDALKAIYFQGDAPTLGTGAFISSYKLSAVYYRKATEGSFEPTYGDIETKLWDPIIQDRASDFGIQSSGAFAFDIKAEGIKGAQVKVEVSADLITWEAQEIFDMLSDDYAETFTDDLASSHSKRFYRLNMP